ncbi:DUF7147 family protein [Staphylococcus pettenkoferi]|uniref:DUF7147 domain-containing protein n=1 Tax=Staphylococcus pettenkoferi TaxID=170573 RepID=A0A9Q4GZD0_9STAP|nr:hypothetical protein [Staphylococcus pettenkoferi]MCY1564049.1 hypothetical protein [Staphylococcus pettenkoferi]MCY1569566.1 hypothetical protein [Staphylococcus pettenkoferi]MCY1575509.1 hypothetical protein [Staphylococcus pettenkoferi]MCY1583964.1 hypothetical protein [Staphylococcus pettenkoferi]MCY1590656.1 hypothetical protein [Staphylococcus pettenkoferi]
MKQSFIPIGHGLTDLFEFLTLMEYNAERVSKMVYFHTPLSDKKLSSVALVMNPTSEQHFQAMYLMQDAVRYPYPETNKKFEMLNEHAKTYNIPVKEVDVHAPEEYPELELYYNYLTSVLRLQNWIPPLQ